METNKASTWTPVLVLVLVTTPGLHAPIRAAICVRDGGNLYTGTDPHVVIDNDAKSVVILTRPSQSSFYLIYDDAVNPGDINEIRCNAPSGATGDLFVYVSRNTGNDAAAGSRIGKVDLMNNIGGWRTRLFYCTANTLWGVNQYGNAAATDAFEIQQIRVKNGDVKGSIKAWGLAGDVRHGIGTIISEQGSITANITSNYTIEKIVTSGASTGSISGSITGTAVTTGITTSSTANGNLTGTVNISGTINNLSIAGAVTGNITAGTIYVGKGSSGNVRSTAGTVTVNSNLYVGESYAGVYTMAGGSLTGAAAMTVATTGTFTGRGTVGLTGCLTNDGKITADGNNADATLSLASFNSVLNTTENTDGYGWFATSKGKLILRDLAITGGTPTYNWGEAAGDTDIDLVNSLVRGTGGCGAAPDVPGLRC
jgi:hypothetical protein